MVFDRIIDRRHTNSSKWEQYGDALPLWVADMDFRAPEPVVEALRARVEHGVFGYTRPAPELREVVQAWLLKRHGWQVEEEAISLVPGVMRGVHMVAYATGREGDGILIQPPVYYPFFSVPENSKRVLQVSEIRRTNGRYQLDFDAFEEAITERTCLFLLCNPHNPIGRAFTANELTRMAEICLRHDLIICSDEIHSDLIFSEARHTPIAALDPEIARRTVTCLAPSKTFNVPGLSCSVMVIEDAELRDKVTAAGAGLVRGSNMMGYTAALAAYRDGEAWLDELLVYLEDNRDYVHRFVESRLPGIQMIKPEATFLAWLDCRGAGIPGELTPHEFFLQEANVALNEGAKFGPGGEGFVRLNFGCPRATLTEALERMEEALRRAR
jgi:cystathionine beta-lyase